tara:strand:+ start:1368 stop:2441 length:1074 start_codon:yes stop_codon:yes gene_type:complete
MKLIKIKQLNLFIAGVGNVGKKLLEQISNQTIYLKEKIGVEIKIVAISSSKKMIFNDSGIEINNWINELNNGEKANELIFFKKSKKLNLKNSVFIDNTASKLISNTYKNYLKNGISVVTCNKIACSDNYSNYLNLKNLSFKHNSSFLFETNVGAGLPIIDTLNNLISSGDRINSIQGVLSGSLNYIFNNFKNINSFDKIVTNAMNEGFTEPDPKIDLSGIDVARKILILSRVIGEKTELSDVKINSFLPTNCLNTNNTKDFLKCLSKNANHFNKLLNEANSKKSKLKYVAEFNNTNINVGLKSIPKGHHFYNIEESDNIVLFYTQRYHTHPLIIKGAGAGAEVTASGIFRDIIKSSK